MKNSRVTSYIEATNFCRFTKQVCVHKSFENFVHNIQRLSWLISDVNVNVLTAHKKSHQIPVN